MPTCTTCGGQLAAMPAPPGLLGSVWGHAAPAADGHQPGVPPVVVTYREHGGWWDAACPEVPGFPVLGATSLAEAKSIAWALLGRISPARPVVEQTETGDGA